MSVSKVSSFKAYIPPMALATGLCLGVAICAIGDMRRIINESNMNDADVKKGLSQRASIVLGSWIVTSAVAFAGLAFRHPVFKIGAVASSAIPIAVMVSLKGGVQKNSATFQGDTQAKLTRAVVDVFVLAIPALVALSLAFAMDSLER
jgi:hypothetical protein